MAREIQLPCKGEEGECMRCETTPPLEEKLKCGTCGSYWHVPCLLSRPESLASTLEWQCPDCSGDVVPAPISGIAGSQSDGSGLVAAIRAIEADESLTDAEKAKKRQQLVSGKADDDDDEENPELDEGVLATFRQNLTCSICIQLPVRPVTTPCGHNFCLKCFEKWVGQRKFSCPKCRSAIPWKVARKPRINLTLIAAMRVANGSKYTGNVSKAKVYKYIANNDRPDKAFTSVRAKRPGMANACSGKIFVTIPQDHLGPIPAEHDPIRNKGVLVGETWEGRQECKQWGAHFSHMAGIAGQSKFGAQSVALSGGYDDDEDHGEWFLYTGSGGRDLSGNKRTTKEHSFDQKFERANEALRLSCRMGYPVRVVRSDNDKRSTYAPAPNEGLRYDGVYRVEKCWRKVGIQGKFLVCRYLFVRCDNEPAPWTSDEHGDRPRPLPNVPELKKAIDLFERKESPSWDFDESDGQWKWVKPPPPSRKALDALNRKERKRAKKAMNSRNSTVRDKLLKEFGCQICRKLMSFPVTTPCAHNFCKACLEAKFAGISHVRKRSRGGRMLRAQKNVKSCPCCTNDLSDFLENPQVNREVMELIEKLKTKDEEEAVVNDASNTTASTSGIGNMDSEEEEEDEEEEEESQVVSKAEPPKKKIKLDNTEAEATAVV